MGKSKIPSYDENAARASQEWAAQAQSKYGTYGVNSALGGLKTQQNTDGTYSLAYDLNNSDKMRQNLINQSLANLNLDPTKAQEAYYNQATRQLLPQFQLDQNRLHEQLVNRGITEGSALYNEQMNNLMREQNTQLANISDQAVFQGQNYLSNQIGNIGSLASQYDILNIPSMSGSTGAQFESPYDIAYQGQVAAAQSKADGLNQMAGTIGGIVGKGLGYLGKYTGNQPLKKSGNAIARKAE